jgi:ABC-2 type transport system ATP-binding protein
VARAAGVAPQRVDETLHLVGMEQSGRRRVGGYSLGMRQRLALATALLGDPQILVLDEPANGLDPQGIRWLRDFLRAYAAEGRTVLVSSHVLAEMAQTADAVIVIARGKVVAEGPIAELTAPSGAVEIRSPDGERLRAAPIARGFGVEAGTDGTLIVTGADAATVGDLALAEGVALHRLAERAASLEDVFLELTGEEATPG